MDYDYQDKGNYFRGLLILIGKDNKIDSTYLKGGEVYKENTLYCYSYNYIYNDFFTLGRSKTSYER